MGETKLEKNDMSKEAKVIDTTTTNMDKAKYFTDALSSINMKLGLAPKTEYFSMLKQKDISENMPLHRSMFMVQSPDNRVEILGDMVASHESLIKDLLSQVAQIRDGLPAPEPALKRIACDIGSLGFVVSMHYILEGDTLHMVVIHDMEDKIGAMDEFYGRFQPIEGAFPDLYFQNRLLHRDDVTPGRLLDTKCFFTRK